VIWRFFVLLLPAGGEKLLLLVCCSIPEGTLQPDFSKHTKSLMICLLLFVCLPACRDQATAGED
jgi:hypothetical protein